MTNLTNADDPRRTEYVAPGLPTSPIWGRAAGLLLALAAFLGAKVGLDIPTDSATVAVVSGLLFTAWSEWQLRRARKEQAEGVAKLEAVAHAGASGPTLKRFADDGNDKLLEPAEGDPRTFWRDRAGNRNSIGIEVSARAPTSRDVDPDEPVPLLEPRAPVPEPRRHFPSDALIGDDGEPISAGDLDSHDEATP